MDSDNTGTGEQGEMIFSDDMVLAVEGRLSNSALEGEYLAEGDDTQDILDSYDARHELVTVTKSNHLVAAQSQLTGRQQKVLAACISKVNPLGEYDDPETKGIRVALSANELERMTGIERRHLIRFIDETAEAFHSKAIRNPQSKEGDIDWINICLNSVYDKKKGEFVVIFHPKIVKHLIKLTTFTSYKLKWLQPLSSKYALRVYEMACMLYNRRQGGKQIRRVSLENLSFSLGMQDGDSDKSYITGWAEKNRRILKPAVKAVNEKTNVKIDYKPYKSGRFVVGVTFVIEMEFDKALPGDLGGMPLAQEEQSVVQMIQKYGIPKAVAERWVGVYGEEAVQANIELLEHRLQLGDKIRSTSAYLNKLVTKNIAGLPDIANPYSERYKNQRELGEFVRRVVANIWWELDENIRNTLQASEYGLMNHELTALEVGDFLEHARAFSFEDAEEAYSPSLIRDQWNERYLKGNL